MSHNEKGFTLLEIIVALAILSLGFLTLVQLFSGGLRLTTYSEEYLKAMVLAQNQFQELESNDFEMDPMNGEFEEEGYFWEAKVGSYESELRDNAFPVKKVTLRVYWDQEGREKEINLVSIATKGSVSTLTTNDLDIKFNNTNTGKDSSDNESSTNSKGSNTGSNNQNFSQPTSNSTSPNGGSFATGN